MAGEDHLHSSPSGECCYITTAGCCFTRSEIATEEEESFPLEAYGLETISVLLVVFDINCTWYWWWPKSYYRVIIDCTSAIYQERAAVGFYETFDGRICYFCPWLFRRPWFNGQIPVVMSAKSATFAPGEPWREDAEDRGKAVGAQKLEELSHQWLRWGWSPVMGFNDDVGEQKKNWITWMIYAQSERGSALITLDKSNPGDRIRGLRPLKPSTFPDFVSLGNVHHICSR